jgi:hypothetical protein
MDMVPDFQPDMDLIANRKGKRATPDEKAEVYRCSRHMSMQELRELTGRSEDSISKYINEIKAGVEATTAARAEAYGHLTSPDSPVQHAEPVYEDEDSEGPPPSRSRALPPPPPIDDLDDLFDDDDEVDPTEENALAKKLYILLLEHDAVKGKTDEDREYKAGVIAKTFNLFTEYQNPHGLVQHLMSNDVKGGERKATSISRILFGWFGQPGQPGQPQQGYGISPVPPGPPGFNNPYQPQPTGYHPGYGPAHQPYGHQPTQYGPMAQMYPYPQPPPYPPVPTNQKGGITKEDVQKLLDKNIEKRDQFWQEEIRKRDEERASQKKEEKLYGVIDELKAKIDHLEANPPQQPPQGDYEMVEEPVEWDEEGNPTKIKTTYKTLSGTNPETERAMTRLQTIEDKLDQEREATRKDIERLTGEIDKADRERIAAEKDGQIEVEKAKYGYMEKLNKEISEMNAGLHEKELEVIELKNKAKGGQPDEVTVADKKIEMLDRSLTHMADTRKDIVNALLTLAQGGKPKGANVEQWSEDELAQFEGQGG